MELLKLEGVTKEIKKRKIVNNLSIHVDSGEIVGFLGPNGAGKTTTIKMIMGLFSITAGTISVCGHDIKTDFENAMKNVGGIIENPDLYKGITGRQNLEYFASMYGPSAVKNIDSVVTLVKMHDRIDDKVKTYSLGMRQRVGIAQALVHMPSLLILDEPTNGMDPIGIKELRDLLKNITKQSDVGVLVSSHLLAEMELMCDRIYVIDNGVLIGEKAIDPTAQEYSDEEAYEYHFETDADEKTLAIFAGQGLNCEMGLGYVKVIVLRNQVPGLVRMLAGEDISVFAAARMKRSLEEDFISIVTNAEGQLR